MASSTSSNVKKPVDPKSMQADIDRKLQLYGVYCAFQQGKLPSNQQADVALNSFLQSHAMQNASAKLSADGRTLVKDVQDVVSQAKFLLLAKNEGELLQDFIWQSQKIGKEPIPVNWDQSAAPDKEAARQHGQQALEGFKTLGKLIITNGEFRKLLNDATILLRDMAGDAATKAASKVRPSGDQLAQMDNPADNNVWHDAPDMSAGNIRNQLKSAVGKNAPVNQEDIQDAVGDASQNAHPNGSRDPADTAALASQDQQNNTSSGINAQTGLQAGADTLRQRASGNIPEEQKEQARKARERTKNYLNSKMPEERRDQAVWRLKKMIVEIQGHSDYLDAVDTLLSLAETYVGHANKVAQAGSSTVKGAHSNNALQAAETDLKTLIERFANNTSTDDLFESINILYRDADKDPELKSWFKEVDRYIRKALREQGYIMEDAATEDWNRLYDQGNLLLRDRYRNHTDRILDEFKFIGDQFDKDRMNQEFGQSVQKLFNDLGHDENGKTVFKPHLLNDLKDIILPAALERIHYIPVPRIAYSDPMVDIVIDNLVIQSRNFMPNVFEVFNDNHFRVARKNINSANTHSHSISIVVTGLQMDVKDVQYYLKRKQGFPSITDQGALDIVMGGEGLDFEIKLATALDSDQQNLFKVQKVKVNFNNLKLKIRRSKHKLLLAIAKPILLKALRPAFEKAIEKNIKDNLENFDSFAYQVKLEAEKAKQEVLNDPENAPNVYSRYLNAARKQVVEGQQKAQAVAAKTADKQVNVATGTNDVLLPQVQLSGGITGSLRDYRERSQQGNDWRSELFSLGSAAPSTNVPSSPQVTRKPHGVNEGGVRNTSTNGSTAQAPATTNGTNGSGITNAI